MIKCETVMNAENIKKFNHTILRINLFYWLLAIGVIMAVAGAFLDTALIVLGAFFVINALYLVIYVELSIKTYIKSNKKISESTISTVTLNEGILVEEVTVGGRLVEKTEYNLADLYKATETGKYFYIFNSSKTALILDKNGFKEGTVDHFSDKLRAALPRNRYRLTK